MLWQHHHQRDQVELPRGLEATAKMQFATRAEWILEDPSLLELLEEELPSLYQGTPHRFHVYSGDP